MRNKIIMFLTALLVFSLTSCRNYTSTRNDKKPESNNEQAVQEEKDALDNMPRLSLNGIELWETIGRKDGFSFDYNKTEDRVSLESDNMQIVAGGEKIGVVYFVLYDANPLDNNKLKEELFDVVNIISEYTGIQYNENAIIESLNNVDYSKVRDSYSNNYSNNVELYSCLWNDGKKDCIDFRIIPKG